MTPDIDKLEALEQSATPGEWGEGVSGNMRIYAPDNMGIESGLVAECMRRRDLSFVVAIRNAAPDLIRTICEQAAEIERLQKENANLGRALVGTAADLTLADARSNARDEEIERLKGIIAGAPHGTSCCTQRMCSTPYLCNCWKAGL